MLFWKPFFFRYAVKHAIWIFQIIFWLTFLLNHSKNQHDKLWCSLIKKIIRKACARAFHWWNVYCLYTYPRTKIGATKDAAKFYMIVYTQIQILVISLRKRVVILSSDFWWHNLIVIGVLVKIFTKKVLSFF